MKSLTITAILLATTVACTKGTSNPVDQRNIETKALTAQYTGRFVDSDTGNSWTILADGTTYRMAKGQVGGGEESHVPDETVCSYVQIGKIKSFSKRSIEDRRRYIDFADHLFKFEVSKVALTSELDSGTDTPTLENPNCKIFLAEQNDEISQRGPSVYSVYVELFDSGFRTQDSGGGDYVQSGLRTPSTLDENYKKVHSN